ncbi:MAG: 3'-5' exonuclease [Gemmatimonadetes bacterium]|nr:3'-5' exonuclease [Gemmatimonadota bacterium]
MTGVIRAYPADRADPSLDGLEYAVVDCETTGGSPGRGHRITEIAAIRVNRRGFITDEFRSLINPLRPIPRAITRITNISEAMVAEAPQFVEIAPRVQQVLAGAVFVAHNAPFDLRFVQWEMKRGDFGAPKGRVLCTARLARKMIPEMRHKSLDALIWFYGLVCEPRHRAYPDARVTAEVLVRLLDRAEESGIGTWDALEAALRARKKRKKRTSLPTSMEFPEWA